MLKSVQTLFPVALRDVQQAQVIPSPRIAAIKFDRRLELLFGFDVFLFAEMFDAAPDNDAFDEFVGEEARTAGALAGVAVAGGCS
mgnify:CR=1 FL=1